MLSRLKSALIGIPLPTQQLAEKRLNKIRALAAFSPDALSSIAYANQEIYLGLVVAGSAGLGLAWPIGLAITLLLVIVALSYFQTIQGYPSGGGSYVVARENLGTLPGLVAAAALLIDYLLTAAVSLTAGVEAIASAFPALYNVRIEIALVLLALITIANLRGLRETGTLMAIPVYLFLFTYLPMLLYGIVVLFTHGRVPIASVAPPAAQPLTLFLILHTFATGCTALTGVEAISNGVPAFKPPESKNAGRTLIVMAILMGILFAGSIGLTQFLGIIAGPHETILSALARKLLGNGPVYVLIQFSTMLILAVAANTSFAGFPRLAAILAKDGFLPRQFTGLGDRLVFANGIISLSIATGVLIIIFGGTSHLLIPLFAVGVFLAFTLSQAGMVRHWWRDRANNLRWLPKAVINGVGALATLATLFIVGISKFREGAWIIVLLIPLFVIGFQRIRLHYLNVGKQLSMRGLPPDLKPMPPLRLVIPVSGVHRGIIEAMDFALSISKDVTAVYIELDPGAGEQMRKDWECWWPDVPLVVLPSPYRSIVRPLLDYLDEDDRQHNDGTLAAVVLPEFVPARWWQQLLHNQTSLLIKTALLYRRRTQGFQRIIIDVPYHLKK
jgi:amino acid transporter